MPSNSKKQSTTNIGTKPLISVDPSLPSFETHPFFEKKAVAAKRILKHVGLPKDLSGFTLNVRKS